MPVFKINNELIEVYNKYTYLGHIMTDTLTDDLDIYWQRKKIFAQGNSLLRKFFMCTIEVKTTLLNKRESTRPICVGLNVKYCPALIRNLVYKFMNRLLMSKNMIIKAICDSSCFYRSTMWKHWRKLLYVNGVG